MRNRRQTGFTLIELVLGQKCEQPGQGIWYLPHDTHQAGQLLDDRRGLAGAEKLKSLPNASSYLKDGIDFEQLDADAYQISDNEAARQLNDAKTELFKSINQARTSVA